MNRSRVSEACGGTFKLPGVIGTVLKDKHSRVAVSELDPTAMKALKNDVSEWVLAVIFI